MNYKCVCVLKLDFRKYWGIFLKDKNTSFVGRATSEGKGRGAEEEKGEKPEPGKSPGRSASSLENVVIKHDLDVGAGGEVGRWKAQGSRKEESFIHQRPETKWVGWPWSATPLRGEKGKERRKEGREAESRQRRG